MDKFYLRNKEFKEAYVFDYEFIAGSIAVLETKELDKVLSFRDKEEAERTAEFINENSFLKYEVVKEKIGG